MKIIMFTISYQDYFCWMIRIASYLPDYTCSKTLMYIRSPYNFHVLNARQTLYVRQWLPGISNIVRVNLRALFGSYNVM